MGDWFYRRQGEQFGPVSWDELRQLVRSGRLDPSEPVSQDGMTGWRVAGEVEGLFLPPAFPPKRQAASAAAGTRTGTASESALGERQPPPCPQKNAVALPAHSDAVITAEVMDEPVQSQARAEAASSPVASSVTSFAPPPFPETRAAVHTHRAVPSSSASGVQGHTSHRLLGEKPSPAGTLASEQAHATVDTTLPASRRPQLDSPDHRVPQRHEPRLRQVAIIGGCFVVLLGVVSLVLFGVAFLVSLLGTSGKPGSGGSSMSRSSQQRRGGIEQDLADARNKLLYKGLPSYIRGTDSSRLAAWKAAAEKGVPEAQWLHGLVLLYGARCREAPEEAVKWFHKAAEQGNADAQFALGGCYQFGRGVSRDDAESAKWYREAAEQGFAMAQTMLGALYAEGQGVPKNDVEAAKWYRKAAEQGYAEAQFDFGTCYDRGLGTPKDHTEMVKWYRRAAEQGFAAAQHNLGCCYDDGEGVPKDRTEAVRWLRKAADQGYVRSRKRLVAMGETVPIPKMTCRALAEQVAALCGNGLFVAFEPTKPGYDVSYSTPGVVTKADIISTIGAPDSGGSVRTGEYGYVGDEEWIYRCKDGEVCLQLCPNPNPGYVTIPNFGVHSRSR